MALSVYVHVCGAWMYYTNKNNVYKTLNFICMLLYIRTYVKYIYM